MSVTRARIEILTERMNLDDVIASHLREIHKGLMDPEASQIWGLLMAWDKWKLPTMPLHELEADLVARVIHCRGLLPG